MLSRTFRQWLGSVSLLVAVGFGAVAPANAIIIGGAWDPWYGSPFLGSNPNSKSDDMWWSGTALFEIPDACGVNGLLTSANCNGMSVKSVTVYLTLGNGGPVLSTLTFPNIPNNATALTKVQFNQSGNVSWVESNWWNPLVSGTGTTFDLSNYFFSVGFSENGANLFHVKDGAYLDRHGSHGPDGKTFFWNGQGLGHKGELCGPNSGVPDGDPCGFSDQYGKMVFSRIPEPSTYALMFAGLAVLGFTARRRRQPSA